VRLWSGEKGTVDLPVQHDQHGHSWPDFHGSRLTSPIPPMKVKFAELT